MKGQQLAGLGRWVMVGLSLTLAGASLTPASDLALHDDFNGSTQISPDKWFGLESRRSRSMQEAYRFVQGDQLHLGAVGYGGLESNQGRRTAAFGLGMMTPRPVTTLQAELTVTHAKAEACPENTLTSQGRAQLVGFFFNDGSRKHKGGLNGDVVALMEKVADSQDGPFIRALVLRCTSRHCGTGDTIKALLFTHKWKLSQPDVLRIEWQPPNAQFVFTLNPGSEVEERRRIAYDPSTGPRKALPLQRQSVRVRTHGANCRSGRRGTVMAVAVDDVHLQVLDSSVTSILNSPVRTSPVESERAASLARQREELSEPVEW